MLPTPGTFSVLPRWLSRWCKLTGIALGIILPATGANADPTDPWQSALNLDYNTASDGLARQHDVAPDDLRITVPTPQACSCANQSPMPMWRRLVVSWKA